LFVRPNPYPPDLTLLRLLTGPSTEDMSAGVLFTEIETHAGHYAACEGVVAELNAGVSVNVRDRFCRNNGATPLIAASFSGNVLLVKVLLKRGADVNAQQDDGETALIAGCNYLSILRLLLDISLTRNDGKKALDLARRWNFNGCLDNCVELLEAHDPVLMEQRRQIANVLRREQEKERLEHQRREQERLEQQQREQERLERLDQQRRREELEKREQERLEQQSRQQKRFEREQREREQQERQRQQEQKQQQERERAQQKQEAFQQKFTDDWKTTPLDKWSVDDVCSHFHSLGVNDPGLVRLREQMIDGSVLVDLSESELRGAPLSLPLGAVKKHFRWRREERTQHTRYIEPAKAPSAPTPTRPPFSPGMSSKDVASDALKEEARIKRTNTLFQDLAILERELNAHSKRDPYSFLKYVYLNFPPLSGDACGDLNPEVLVVTLKRAQFHYHPDRQANSDTKWVRVCEIIIASLNEFKKRQVK